MHKSKITGLGFEVPENVVKNADLEEIMETSDEWIQKRSGIKERRWATEDLATSDLAISASKKAMEMAGVSSEDIDLVIVGTLSSDYFFPGVSAQLQDKLNLRNIAAFDIKAACSAFVYCLSVGDQFIRSGMAKTALIVGAETQTKLIDKTKRGRDIAVLFGDGAGAILSTHLHCQGKDMKNLWMEGPGSAPGVWIHNKQAIAHGRLSPKMNGREVFRNAVKRFPEVIQEAMDENGLTMEDIKLIIPHQANNRISQAVAKRMGIGMDRVYSNIHKYGNTTAASIPIALTEAHQEGKIQKGDHIILAAFGAGYTWASAAIRW
jgi:3-oxoacyl-[acyl-carrier-protein] synthase-3